MFFKGKPNSGSITLVYLDSNLFNRKPYPSALDADEFSKDNLAGRREGKVNFQWSPLYFLGPFWSIK
jgi:hypothetical protein